MVLIYLLYLCSRVSFRIIKGRGGAITNLVLEGGYNICTYAHGILNVYRTHAVQ